MPGFTPPPLDSEQSTGGGFTPPPLDSEHQQSSPLSAVGDAFHSAVDMTKGAMSSVQEGLLDAQHHPLEQAMNVLGAGQRGIGEIVRQTERAHAGQQFDTSAIMESVFHPSDEVNARTTESIRALVHAPTHDAIAQWANGIHGLTDTEKAWLTTGAQAAEDFGLQTMSDPLTLADGLGSIAHLAAGTLRGTKTAGAMLKAAKSVGMGKAFEHLMGTGDAYAQGSTALQKIARSVRSAGIRPDLDPIFTLDGKRMRLSIENKWYNRLGQAAADDQKLVQAGNSAAISQRYLEYVYRTASPEDRQLLVQHFGVTPPNAAQAPQFAKARFDVAAHTNSIRQGFIKRGKVPTQADIQQALAKRRAAFDATRLRSLRQQVASFMNGTPEEQLKELNTTRKTLRDGLVNMETEQLAARDKSILKDPNGVVDFSKLDTQDPFKQNLTKLLQSIHIPYSDKLPFRKGDPLSMFDILHGSRTLSRISITMKPWIHELRNVGELAYHAGGLHMVPYALWHAARYAEGASAADIARLDKIGALPTFFHDQSANLLGRAPVFKQIQDAMQRVDIGYRAALLKTLDKVSGSSKQLAEQAVEREYKAAGKSINDPQFTRDVATRWHQNELLKGRTIAERIGDPRNQDRIVQLFEAFGGYFPVFRLGIVPRNVLATLMEHPGRVVSPIRARVDYNANRPDNNQTEYEMGGPTPDAAQFVESLSGIGFAQPPKYFTSPATSGLPGEAVRAPYGDAGANPLGTAADMTQSFIPYSYDARDAYKTLTGASATAPPELRDKLAEWLWNFLTGFYERNQQNAHIQQGQLHQIEREYQ